MNVFGVRILIHRQSPFSLNCRHRRKVKEYVQYVSSLSAQNTGDEKITNFRCDVFLNLVHLTRAYLGTIRINPGYDSFNACNIKRAVNAVIYYWKRLPRRSSTDAMDTRRFVGFPTQSDTDTQHGRLLELAMVDVIFSLFGVVTACGEFQH